MRHEFEAEVKGMSKGGTVWWARLPPEIILDAGRAQMTRCGVPDADRDDVARLVGRRVMVTIETIGDE